MIERSFIWFFETIVFALIVNYQNFSKKFDIFKAFDNDMDHKLQTGDDIKYLNLEFTIGNQ